MTFHVNPKGRDFGSLVNWDDLGKLYAGIAVAWTIILCAGSGWLLINRNLSFLKIRNIPLAIIAVAFLHVYLVKILLAYTINGHFPCAAEYWIMSIYLPFGIALFQANVAQLQSVSDHQQRMLEEKQWLDRKLQNLKHARSMRGLVERWHELTVLRKTYVYIALAMLAQLIITSAIFGTSGKLLGHWPMNYSSEQREIKCRKGLEWIPSAIWQIWWSCFYGPYLLYRIRNVKDAHYWRLQIIFSVIAGIPGSPLWLAAVQSSAFHPVNLRWVPPMWLAPGIMVMQAVTIFFPIYEAYRWHRNRLATLEAIKSWDEKRMLTENSTLNSNSNRSQNTNYTSTSANTHKSYFANGSTTTSRSVRSKEMHTMAALEKALTMNPLPLLHFAATKDFTAENIVFLIQIRDWRTTWARLAASSTTTSPTALPTPDDQTRAHLFTAGLSIYQSSVSGATAEFPINISSATKRALDLVFAKAAAERMPYRDDSIVDFFKDRDARTTLSYDWSGFASEARARAVIAGGDAGRAPSPPTYAMYAPARTSEQTLAGSRESGSNEFKEFNFSDEEKKAESGGVPVAVEKKSVERRSVGEWKFEPSPCVRPPTKGRGLDMVEGFGEGVFDEAERSIKYLVLTNTWQKFVGERSAVSP